MNMQLIREILAVVAGLSSIAYGIATKNDTLIVGGLATLGAVSAVHGVADKLVANKSTVEGIVGVATQVLDSVAPGMKGYIDPASATIDEILEDIAKAKVTMAAQAAPASGAPKSPVAS